MFAQAQAHLEGLLTAHNTHDAAGFAARFAPDGVLRIAPPDDTAQGRRQIEELLAEMLRAFPDCQLLRRRVDDCTEGAWVEWTMTGTHAGEFMGHPATHRGFELVGCSRFTFAGDGQIAEETLYFDPATILHQLGLVRGHRTGV